MKVVVELKSSLVDSPRVAQVRGLFDLEPSAVDHHVRSHELAIEEKPWNIGLITGPSGSGKSTLSKVLWPDAILPTNPWHPDASLLDSFPMELGVKEVVEILSSVGFSSPPAWLRPFASLSNGQQFRATLALLIAQAKAKPSATPIVFDEFTSVVDRTVARIGSTALAKIIRKMEMKFVAVTCHDDIIEWLQPDWIYRVDEGLFTWRCLRRRPEIELEIIRTKASAWHLFAPHHYLSTSIAPSAICYLASWNKQPVAFSAWLPFVGKGPATRREHRTVCLPDFQGVGIGQALSATIASMFKGLELRAISTTTHPGLIASRIRSPHWQLKRAPSLAHGSQGKMNLSHARTRLTAGFEYIGKAMPSRLARDLFRTQQS